MPIDIHCQYMPLASFLTASYRSSSIPLRIHLRRDAKNGNIEPARVGRVQTKVGRSGEERKAVDYKLFGSDPGETMERAKCRENTTQESDAVARPEVLNQQGSAKL